MSLRLTALVSTALALSFSTACQHTGPQARVRTGPAVRTAAPITVFIDVSATGPDAGQLALTSTSGTLIDAVTSIQNISTPQTLAFSISSSTDLIFYSQLSPSVPSPSNQRLALRIEPNDVPEDPVAWGITLTNSQWSGSSFTFGLKVPGVSEQTVPISMNGTATFVYNKNGTFSINQKQVR